MDWRKYGKHGRKDSCLIDKSLLCQRSLPVDINTCDPEARFWLGRPRFTEELLGTRNSTFLLKSVLCRHISALKFLLLY